MSESCFNQKVINKPLFSSCFLMKFFVFIVFMSLFGKVGFNQTIFYQDVFHGGVTADGFTTTLGSGIGTITLAIPPSSSIDKAFLFCGRHGNPNPITVTFNGSLIVFSNSTIISLPFLSPLYAGIGGNGSVHVADVSGYISSTQLSYQIEVPTQSDSDIRYTDFYLVFIYKDNSLSKTVCSIFINDNDIG